MFIGLLVALCIVVPVANLLIPESSSLHISTYTVTLLGKYLCFALLQKSLCYKLHPVFQKVR